MVLVFRVGVGSSKLLEFGLVPDLIILIRVSAPYLCPRYNPRYFFIFQERKPEYKGAPLPSPIDVQSSIRYLLPSSCRSLETYRTEPPSAGAAPYYNILHIEYDILYFDGVSS